MVSRELAKQLSDSIRDGKLAVGTLLPPTRQLAAKYRVSVGTVQVALRELETQRLIECVPRKGAYVRNVGKPLLETAARQIAILGAGETPVPEVADMYTSRILHAAAEVLYPHRYFLVALSIGTSDDWWDRFLARLDLMGQDLAGVIAFPRPELSRIIEELDRRGTRFVTIGDPNLGTRENFISADNLTGSRLAGRCFAKLGFERVAIIGNEVRAFASMMQKVMGFFQGYLELGAPTHSLRLLRSSSIEEIQGYMAMKSYLAEHGTPQGVFAEGDLLAQGAIVALKEANISLPADTSVIGCTGLHLAEHMSPTLSVVAQPMEAMGRALGELLRNLVEQDHQRLPARHIPTRLILRESVAAPEQLRLEIEEMQANIRTD